MIVLRGAFILAACVAVVTPRLAAQQTPDPVALQKAARAYVEQYATTVSGVSLDETLVLLETSSGERRVPQRISADMVLVRFDDRLMGLRDLYAVDTRPLRQHQPRVVEALSKPTQANVDLAQKYVREHAAFLMHNIVVWYTDPVMTLQYVSAAQEAKLTYKLEGSKKINGVQTYGLGFKEAKEGPRVLSEIPGNAESWGRLWIDPATGAVHMTELWVQSKTDIVRVQVNFELDKKLGWLLPRRASHNLEWRERGNNFTTTIGGSQIKLSFESNADYTNPRYAPVDLGRGKTRD